MREFDVVIKRNVTKPEFAKVRVTAESLEKAIEVAYIVPEETLDSYEWQRFSDDYTTYEKVEMVTEV